MDDGTDEATDDEVAAVVGVTTAALVELDVDVGMSTAPVLEADVAPELGADVASAVDEADDAKAAVLELDEGDCVEAEELDCEEAEELEPGAVTIGAPLELDAVVVIEDVLEMEDGVRVEVELEEDVTALGADVDEDVAAEVAVDEDVTAAVLDEDACVDVAAEVGVGVDVGLTTTEPVEAVDDGAVDGSLDDVDELDELDELDDDEEDTTHGHGPSIGQHRAPAPHGLTVTPHALATDGRSSKLIPLRHTSFNFTPSDGHVVP